MNHLAATLLLLPAAEALERMRAVHWRFVLRLYDDERWWWCWDRERLKRAGCIELEPNVWLDNDRWPSAEIAEQKALENVRRVNAKTGFKAAAFLRAEPFEGAA